MFAQQYKIIMVHRVSAKDLSVGEQVEKSEHPWASRSVARKIAQDHLRENPKAYSSGKGVYYLLANLAGIAAATGWNYVMNKKVTWG